MIKLSSTVSTQIRFSLQSLNESNSDSVFHELQQFVDNGIEGSILVLRSCLDHLIKYRNELNNMKIEPLFASIFKHIMEKPNFTTVFCQSLGSTEITQDFLRDLSDALQLSVSEKVVISLALTDAENPETRLCGRKYCMAQIEALSADRSPKSAELIQNIVLFLQKSEDLSKHVDSFMQMLSLVQVSDDDQVLLTPFLPGELQEANFFRNVGLLDESGDNYFDAILAELEREMSMADVLKELGYGCSVDIAHCKEILSLFLPLTEATIARILGVMACSHVGLEDNQNTFATFSQALCCSTVPDLPPLNSWNVDVLIKTIKQLAPGINWVRVMENLDHEGFYIPNEDAFTYFMSAYRLACQDPFPLHSVCGSIWRNTEGQLSFLRYAVLAPPEVFNFAYSGRQLAYADAVHGHKLQLGHANHAWLCLDLIDVLCQLAERGHVHFVQLILQYPLTHCPEVLLLGMAHVTTTYNLVQHEVSSTVFPSMVKSAMASGMVLHLWHVNPSIVLRGFMDVFKSEPDSLSRILEICQELLILSSVLEMIPSPIGIRLAALASRKELLDLEKWLSTNLNAYKDVFFQECLKFVKEVQLDGSQPFQRSSALLNLHIEMSLTVLKVLKVHSSIVMSSQLVEDMERLHQTVMDSNQQLQNGGAAESSTSDGHGEDIEAEANSYFQQMFAGQLSPDAMVQMLARFRESPLKREQAIFDCMIANLFEEYRFFPKYPERQLKVAAILFGSVIKHQLVTHLTLGIALRGVLDALRKPADSKMYTFGTKALEQFPSRLIEWPQYCNHILQIGHLRGTHPEIVTSIEQALARISSGHSESDGGNNSGGQNFVPVHPTVGNVEAYCLIHPAPQVPSSVQLPQVPPALGFLHSSKGSTSARFGSALNIETLVAAAQRRETPIEAPASEVQDKISFIINNISVANIEAKAKEFTKILKEQYYPWFAQYMVMKRASIEPNFHDLYLKFLDKVGLKALNKEIVLATYENCKVLLGSELIKSSSEERSLLKNLGSWLGKLTIGRNQVLRALEIDPKSLIIEAYEKGLMIAVIPFTSKVLEPCQSSLAYQPPNPWTMGILGLLAEIYSMPNLKMNLKFDIEVLFKNLGVDMKDVQPTSLLKDCKREIEGNPDFSNKDLGVSQPHIPSPSHPELPLDVPSTPNSSGLSHLPPQYPLHLPYQMEDEKLSDQSPAPGMLQNTSSRSPLSVGQLPSSMSNIVNHVVINPKLNAFGLQFSFQRVVPMAMDRAVNEIVSGIVQRSVSIATQTTKELVMKDYAMESDDTRIYNAAHLMVASLAGSLAHVTCKEPLRASISNHLRNSLQGLNIASEVLEQAVVLVTNDNLDLGCAVIENAATEKAIQTIDAEIANQLTARRKQREGVGSSFFDPNLFAQGSMGIVPEALRPKPGHLSMSQQRVYKDFVRLPWQSQSGQSSQSLPAGSTSSGDVGILAAYVSSGNSGFDAMPRPLDVAFEAIEPSSNVLQGGPSVHIGPTDGMLQQSSENDSASASVPASPSAPVLHSVNASDVVKIDQGASSQPLPSPAVTDRIGSSISEPSLSTRDAIDKYQLVAQKLEALVANSAKESEIQGVVAEVPEIILRCISRDEAALAVAQKVFKGLYVNVLNGLHVNAQLEILAAIRDVCKLVVKELTSWVIYSDEERKLNKDITVGLIRSELLNLAEYNVHMAKLIDGGRNKAAMDFPVSLLQTLVTGESRVISELHNLVDALSKVASKPGSPEALQQLIEIIKNPVNADSVSSAAAGKEDEARQNRDKKISGMSISHKEDSNMESESDPNGFRDQVALLFAEWYQICELPGNTDAVCTNYILQLHQHGLLKGDDMTDRFFRLLTELSVAHCLSTESINSGAMQSSQQAHSFSFLAIDIYGKLVFSILKYCSAEQGPSKFFLSSKILSVTVRFIQRDAEEKKASFNPRPYFRLFINFLQDLYSLEPVVDGANFQILTAFASAFHALQPLKVPAFSFAWLELISHRSFMPKLLTINAQKGWPLVQRLLVDLLQFLEPFLRNAQLGVPVQFLYKGTVRVLLVLLHDFPEFLCDYHLTFCDVIPPSCIQMRNIILSAFPRNMRLPDLSTPNLKIDLLPEIREPPRILSEVDAALKASQMKADVDDYLKTRQQGSLFLTELKQKLLLPPSEVALAGTPYNVPLINSLVLSVGIQAIQQLQSRSPNAQAASGGQGAEYLSASLDIYMSLIQDLDTEGRYLFLNAIANQLRYPNNHTHYFSFILLYLFAKANQEIIQDQITRMLLERLIVNKPHPWGLLITFIELIKNPRYHFWNRSFIRCAPEIEKVFESVARSCGGLKPPDESMVSGWVADKTH